MSRLRELQEKKWTIEARLRICPNAQTRAKWSSNLKEVEKLIKINKKMEKLKNGGSTK